MNEITGWTMLWDGWRLIANLIWSIGTLICGLKWALDGGRFWMVCFIMCALFMLESDVYLHVAFKKYPKEE